MARVRALPRGVAGPADLHPWLPGWFQTLADPAVAAGLLIAAVSLWKPGIPRGIASAGVPQLLLGQAWVRAQVASLAGRPDALMELGLWLGLIPLFALAALALFQIGEAALIALFRRTRPGRA
jgi:hypothetical protein